MIPAADRGDGVSTKSNSHVDRRADLVDRAKRHLWLAFGRGNAYFDDPSTSPIIESAEGIYVVDIEGRRYIDASGAQGAASVGFGNSEVKAAIAAQLDTMASNPSTFPAHPLLVDLAERIASLAPKGLTKVFFAVSGTDANETAVKIVRQYFRLTGRAAKRAIVVRWNGYHGTSLTMTSASGMTARRRLVEPLPPGFIHIEPPYSYRPPYGLSDTEWAGIASDELDRAIERHDASNVAAFMGEPTMGAGGGIPAPPGYWKRIREICDRNDLLLVFDEIITAFGRTGEWFAAAKLFREEGVRPDLITFGKGVSGGYYPVSGVIARDAIAAAFEESPDSYLHDGYTYGGAPLGAAAALATLNFLRDHRVLESVPDRAKRFIAGLGAIQSGSQIFGDLRSDGLMVAIELVRNRTTRQPFADIRSARQIVLRECLKNGVLAISMGTTLMLNPPLTITADEIDELVHRIGKALAAVEETLR